MKRVFHFITGSLAILFFMFGLAPILSRVPVLKDIIHKARRENVDTQALFYTESPTSLKIDAQRRHRHQEHSDSIFPEKKKVNEKRENPPH